MATFSVSGNDADGNSSVSSETRERLTALVTSHDFDEAERAVMVAALVQLNLTPTMDTLSEVARQVRRTVKSKGTTMPLSMSDYRESLLRAAAVALGIDKDLAAGIISAAFDRARRELDAEFEARPERTAMRNACEEIRADRSLEQVRTTVCALVKKHGLTPEQVDRAAILRAMGVDSHPGRHDAPSKAALAEAERTIAVGIQVALTDWGKTDTEEMALIRRAPTVGNVLGLVDKAAKPERRYVPAATFERAINVAILEAEGRVCMPEFEIGRAVENECAALKANPSLSQFKASALKVALRDGFVVVDILERLSAAMRDAHLPESPPVIAPDTVLAVPPAPEPEAPQGPQPVSLVTKVTHHDPLPDFTPTDGWAPSGSSETLRPDENGVIHAGTAPGMVKELGSSRQLTPPPTPAEPSTRARKLTEWDEGSVARKINSDARIAKKHDSLAARRGIAR